MKHFVRRLIIAAQAFAAGKPLPVPYGIVDIAEVQPLNFSMEAFTGQPLPKRSWWPIG